MMVSSRLAKAAVKFAGMCCATTIGQPKILGIGGRTISSAAGPPVDVPIRTSPAGRTCRGAGFLMRGCGLRRASATPSAETDA